MYMRETAKKCTTPFLLFQKPPAQKESKSVAVTSESLILEIRNETSHESIPLEISIPANLWRDFYGVFFQYVHRYHGDRRCSVFRDFHGNELDEVIPSRVRAWKRLLR